MLRLIYGRIGSGAETISSSWRNLFVYTFKFNKTLEEKRSIYIR